MGSIKYLMNDKKLIANQQLLPFLARVIRAKYAPTYLGMSRDVFKKDVRPHVDKVRIGSQGIGYDRLDIDACWEHCKRHSECSSKQKMGDTLCRNLYIVETESFGAKSRNTGKSIKHRASIEYTSTLTRITQMKPKRS